MNDPQTSSESAWSVVEAYHQASKHAYDRFARSSDYLDWANQPDPFRRFAGAELIRLPLASVDRTPAYDRLYEPGPVSPQAVDRQSIGELFQYSLAVSAWKQYGGDRWALRVNPSSGNLHPTEGYLVIHAVEGIGRLPAVYHYAPKEHGLERRTELATRSWKSLTAGFPAGAFLVGLTDIHWREAWKYGERAYRYCQHDLGHALACLRIAAAALGWRLQVLEGIADDAIARLLGLDRVDDFPLEDREVPALVAVVWPDNGLGVERELPTTLPRSVADSIGAGRWYGAANRLSGSHVRWEAIDEVSAACTKPVTHPSPPVLPDQIRIAPPRPTPHTAGEIIRRRRSALSMDRRTSIHRDAFYSILCRLLPAAGAMPWDAVGWRPSVSLGLFVHRVEGLSPGLYAMARDPAHLEDLWDAMRSDFKWRRVQMCPEGLPLRQLREGGVRGLATRVSCGQAIAGDGAFSVAMLADWQTAAARGQPWFYRRMLWETGMIGQVLYLEAEAAGLRGTGIGCFFDDPVDEVFGIRERRFQSLYHFTVGGPVEDTRVTTLPAYDRNR